MARNRCRAATAAASADATRRVGSPTLPEDRSTSWPEIGQAIATRVREKKTGPKVLSLEEMTRVRRVVTAPVSEVSDPPSALAGTMDARHVRPNGWRVRGE
jgi:hypothetical protein